MEEKNWGEGIPVYGRKDVLSEEDLLSMAIDLVAEQEITEKGYELTASSYNPDSIPNLVFRKEKDGKYQFIAVKAAVSPNVPDLDPQLHGIMLAQAAKFDARAWFAAVSFGSEDRERFEKGLALKGDHFRIRYSGLQKILPPTV